MQILLGAVFFCAVVTGGSWVARADQIFSVIEVYCGASEGVFDIQFNLRWNMHFLYDGNTPRFLWTQNPRAGSYECKLPNNVIILKYEQQGDPMAVPPGTYKWLPANPKANYVPFDVTFQILVNGKQVIKPTAIVENCKLPRLKRDKKRILRISIRTGGTRDDLSIYADRIGEDYKSDAFFGHIQKKIYPKSESPDFCF